jgi:hypothetical protein
VGRSRHAFVALAGSLLLLAGILPGPALGTTIWRKNLFDARGFLYQDPYYTACTAASAMMMLNFIALAGTGGGGFRWTTHRTKNNPDPADVRDLTSVLRFERSHDTLAPGSAGSDPHGWRNALNYYGWGIAAMTNPALMVYEDRAFGGFDTALKTAVRAIARFNKPVGMLGWAGHHAQVIHGYVVTGEDPSVSSNFTVSAVYLSDPLRSDGFVNKLVSRANLLGGNLRYRFQSYRAKDSPYDDPYEPGFLYSSVQSPASEWYRRWVIVAPVRDGLPAPTPTPDPSPSPSPTPDPGASQQPDPSASTSPDSTPSPSSDPGSLATLDTSGSPAPSDSPTPDPTSSPPVDASSSPAAGDAATPDPSLQPSPSG